MADAGLAIDLLTRCNALGVKIALDDFGTHYSSLTYLQKLPIDTIKIDRSFVQDLPSSDKDGAIVRGVIALGHDMRRKIVAEGVETRAQFDWLQEATCDVAQGYFVAKPAAADQLGVWKQSEIRGRKIA
jgi:EAL domain-containing protein (putative c-di-GMP-specific phosphodiesterase class I)